jgi:hypothetical protein
VSGEPGGRAELGQILEHQHHRVQSLLMPTLSDFDQVLDDPWMQSIGTVRVTGLNQTHNLSLSLRIPKVNVSRPRHRWIRHGYARPGKIPSRATANTPTLEQDEIGGERDVTRD